MGLCTLTELYDFPFSVLFPVLEAVHWSRENPNLSWPSYAFDLIGRNDLTILKINSECVSSTTDEQMGGQSLENATIHEEMAGLEDNDQLLEPQNRRDFQYSKLVDIFLEIFEKKKFN